MGGSDMPYLYTPTTHRHSYATDYNYPHSNFNPKAVTQASYARLSQQSINTSPPKKREGPLINFNEHPDSYVVYSGDRPEFKPVHKGAKRWIVGVRWFQFGLRVVTEIMALGLLVCAVCLTNVDGAAKYLIRIPVSLPTKLPFHTTCSRHVLCRQHTDINPSNSKLGTL